MCHSSLIKAKVTWKMKWSFSFVLPTIFYPPVLFCFVLLFFFPNLETSAMLLKAGELSRHFSFMRIQLIVLQSVKRTVSFAIGINGSTNERF